MDDWMVIGTIGVIVGLPSTIILHRGVARSYRDGIHRTKVSAGIAARLAILWAIAWVPFFAAGMFPLAPLAIPLAAPLAVRLGFLLMGTPRRAPAAGRAEHVWGYESYKFAGAAVFMGGYMPQVAVLIHQYTP